MMVVVKVLILSLIALVTQEKMNVVYVNKGLFWQLIEVYVLIRKVSIRNIWISFVKLVKRQNTFVVFVNQGYIL